MQSIQTLAMHSHIQSFTQGTEFRLHNPLHFTALFYAKVDVMMKNGCKSIYALRAVLKGIITGCFILVTVGREGENDLQSGIITPHALRNQLFNKNLSLLLAEM